MDLLAFLEQAFAAFAVFFHESFYLPLAAVAAFEFFCVKRRKELAAALALALLLAFLAQGFFADPRPCQADASLAKFVECKSSYGMPSLHATVAGVFAIASLGTLAFYFIAPLALLISASRVFLGVHSVSQVVAGLALGMLVYLVVVQLSDRLWKKK